MAGVILLGNLLVGDQHKSLSAKADYRLARLSVNPWPLIRGQCDISMNDTISLLKGDR